MEIYRKSHGHQFRDVGFVWKITGKKRTCTCHKSHFVWKFTGKMPDPPVNTSIEHRVLTVTVSTPQCGHTVWGKTHSDVGRNQKPIDVSRRATFQSLLRPVEQRFQAKMLCKVMKQVLSTQALHFHLQLCQCACGL